MLLPNVTAQIDGLLNWISDVVRSPGFGGRPMPAGEGGGDTVASTPGKNASSQGVKSAGTTVAQSFASYGILAQRRYLHPLAC